MSNNKPVQVDLYNSIIRTNLQFGILDDVIEKPMMIFLLLNGVWFVGESGLIDGPATLMHFVYFFGIPYLFVPIYKSAKPKVISRAYFDSSLSRSYTSNAK